MKQTGKILHIGCAVLAALAGTGILGAGFVKAEETIARNRSIDTSAAANFCFIEAQVEEDEILHLEMEFEKENGQYFYEVKFDTDRAHYEYEVNAYDGTILSGSMEEIPEMQSNGAKGKKDPDTGKAETKAVSGVSADARAGSGEARQRKAYIGVDRAKRIAVRDSGWTVSDVTFSEAKLDEEDGKTVYEIEFYTADMDYEYKIDPWSGAILEASSEKIGNVFGQSNTSGNSSQTGAVQSGAQNSYPGSAPDESSGSDTENSVNMTRTENVDEGSFSHGDAQNNGQSAYSIRTEFWEDDDDWDDDDRGDDDQNEGDWDNDADDWDADDRDADDRDDDDWDDDDDD